jgi:hypothetical protein
MMSREAVRAAARILGFGPALVRGTLREQPADRRLSGWSPFLRGWTGAGAAHAGTGKKSPGSSAVTSCPWLWRIWPTAIFGLPRFSPDPPVRCRLSSSSWPEQTWPVQLWQRRGSLPNAFFGLPQFFRGLRETGHAWLSPEVCLFSWPPERELIRSLQGPASGALRLLQPLRELLFPIFQEGPPAQIRAPEFARRFGPHVSIDQVMELTYLTITTQLRKSQESISGAEK